jgi:peptidyl-prolyl cis-trans isomerase C
MTVKVNGTVVSVDSRAGPEYAVVRELLRQRAIETDLLSPDAGNEEEITGAIERLLAREVQVPAATESECRRYYDTHRAEFRSGDLVHARHILFQVTPSVNVPEVRARAEETLKEVLAAPEIFEVRARQLSNCPSGQADGNLGQIGRGDTVPEFEQAVFRLGPTGILPELVKSRYGFHIVSVDRRIPGTDLPFEKARDRIAETLGELVEEHGLRQDVSVLAGEAEIEGVRVDAATSPLVQ